MLKTWPCIHAATVGDHEWGKLLCLSFSKLAFPNQAGLRVQTGGVIGKWPRQREKTRQRLDRPLGQQGICLGCRARWALHRSAILQQYGTLRFLSSFRALLQPMRSWWMPQGLKRVTVGKETKTSCRWCCDVGTSVVLAGYYCMRYARTSESYTTT